MGARKCVQRHMALQRGLDDTQMKSGPLADTVYPESQGASHRGRSR